MFRISAELADVGETGEVRAQLTINPGQVNEVVIVLTVVLADPCEGRNTVTLADNLGWVSEVWITTDNTFTVDPATQLSSVTDPAGASCGAYSVDFTVTDQNGNPAPASATITETGFSITINFNFDASTTGNWDISVTAYHTNYPNFGSDTKSFSFVAKNPCEESTIALDTAAVVAAWPSSQSIHES